MKDLPNERAFTETPRTRELETITFCVLSELLGRKCSMARKICGIEAGEEIWSERIQAAVSEVHALFSLGFYNLRMESLWEEKDDSPISEGNFFLSALEDHETWKHLAPCQDEERMARFRENVFRKIRIVEIWMTAAEDFPDLQEIGEGWENTAGRVEGILSRQPGRNA